MPAQNLKRIWWLKSPCGYGLWCVLVALLSGCDTDASGAAATSSGSGAPAAAVAVADDEEAGPSPADQRAAIDARLALAAAPNVDARRFRVRVESGVATLESTDATDAERARAQELVAAIEGVRDVQLTGSAAASPAAGSGAAAVAPQEGSVAYPDVDALVGLGDPALVPPPPSEVPTAGSGAAANPPATAVAGTPPIAANTPPVAPPVPEATATADAGAAAAPAGRTYRVQPGDTLSQIASRTMGSGAAWRRLYEYNRDVIGSNPERLRDGMELRIPAE